MTEDEIGRKISAIELIGKESALIAPTTEGGDVTGLNGPCGTEPSMSERGWNATEAAGDINEQTQ